MRDTGIIYANSLYSLAKDEGCEEVILNQLCAVGEAAAENNAVFDALDAPQISFEQKSQIIDTVFGGCHPYIANTIRLLAQDRRSSAFGYMVKQYKKDYNKDHNICDVTAITAVPLSPQNEKNLKEKLKKLLGGEIVLTKKIDPSIIGGIVIRTEGLQIDSGVKHRLEEIKQEIVR